MKTVTASPAPSAQPASLTFPQLVSNVRSGVIRIEAATCNGASIGTGFLISPTLVATVQHVVDSATGIVLKRNGRVLGIGTVIGEDRARDLALVRTSKTISGYIFTLAPRAPALGEAIAAFGFPLGLPLTVTRGSVSGLTRTIPIDNIQRRDLVQTDAALNPGNSGGPLFSTASHEVVGLVDLGTNQANGISFAVSAAVARPLLTAWRQAPQPTPTATCPGSYQAAPAGASSPANAAGGVTAAAAVTNAIYAYWNAIQNGDYATAFSYLSAREQNALGGEKTWISQHDSDPVTNVNVDVTMTSINNSSATAVINQLQTQALQTGCRNWNGTYQLVHTSGAWLIDSAQLAYTAC